MPPEKQSPAPAVTGNGAKSSGFGGAEINSEDSASRSKKQAEIVQITPLRRVRVELRQRRGETSLKIQNETAIMAGSIFLPSGAPLSIPANKIHDLTAALQKLGGTNG